MSTTPDALASASDPLAGHAIARFGEGARTVLRSLSFVARHPTVARWLGLCMVAYTVIWGLVMWEAASWQGRVVEALLGAKGASWWEATLWEIGRALTLLAWWLFAILSVFAIAGPLLSPLFGMLAEACEIAFYGTEPRSITMEQRLREMAHGVLRALGLSSIQLAGSLFFAGAGFLVGMVFPPAGTVVGSVFGGAWAALWFAMIAMSHALENHYVGILAQLELGRRSVALALGFGTIGQFLAWVPFAAPVLVVSGSLLVFRLERHGHVALPLRATGNPSPAP